MLWTMALEKFETASLHAPWHVQSRNSNLLTARARDFEVKSSGRKCPGKELQFGRMRLKRPPLRIVESCDGEKQWILDSRDERNLSLLAS
jgi:hypothetical protein